mmetsp:Transcript_50891/g.131197  ORF Transcript_50891/g.131197 Transcript_50891/m.131197 type:complete len:219 (-) Transcript_50891:108-764(-)
MLREGEADGLRPGHRLWLWVGRRHWSFLAALRLRLWTCEDRVHRPTPQPEVNDRAVHDDVCKAEVELVEDHRAELVEACLDAMHAEDTRRDALELRGIHIRLLAEAVRAAMLRQVCEHEVNLQRPRHRCLDLIGAQLQAELTDIVKLDLLFAVANQEAPRREGALVLDDVCGDQVMVIGACWLLPRLLGLRGAGKVSDRNCKEPLTGLLPEQACLEVV